MLKIFDTLCTEERFIRDEVFVKEQGFKNEYDEVDKIAKHMVFYDGDIPIATCRYYSKIKNNEYIIGRIAIIKPYRGRNIGSYILQTLDTIISSEGGKKISLSAQLRIKEFYEKNGYIAIGKPYYDEHIEHIHMEKCLGVTE